MEANHRDSNTKKINNSVSRFLNKIAEIASRYPVAEGTALIGGIVFLLQLWKYSHLLNSILDEGAYLFKGYLYVSGQYSLYQDYGLWSNKMPLSFLIPGAVQYVFGPGIRTGRYFAILLALLMLFGLWILARRLGGKWWGAIIVWVLALSPAVIQNYSMAASQVLIACMLVWTLVLIVGERRPTWQIAIGALLAGLMAMTRINMILVLPLLLLYTFWEHGRKPGILATSISALTVMIVHAIYLPGILIMWARVLPRFVSPFLDPWRPSILVTDTWSPETSALDRVMSFFLGFRYHFIALFGAFTAWILWPPKDKWRSQSNFRAAVLLTVILLSQLLIHLYFALGNNYCVYCFPGYLSFFSMIGLLLVAASFTSWKTRIPWWLQVILIPIILVFSTGIGFSVFQEYGAQLLEYEIPKFLFDFPKFTKGMVTLDTALINKFDLEYPSRRQAAPAIAGFIAGILIVLIAICVRVIPAIYNHLRKNSSKPLKPSFGYWLLIIFLITGTLLLPTKVIAGSQSIDNCYGDVILAYEAIGKHLAENIPPGSLVYWHESNSLVPLLYIPGVRIFPPQMNGEYSLKEDMDAGTLLKFGFWSNEIAEEWLDETDYVLVEDRSYKGWIRANLDLEQFEELEPTPPTASCKGGTRIRIFKRMP
ncbi:MAG: glycosyltransferase family 39 protein [Chloroflexota bacterium]|nr:glycosyltransferase family 39 protein [Chloroflexota bacterium]